MRNRDYPEYRDRLSQLLKALDQANEAWTDARADLDKRRPDQDPIALASVEAEWKTIAERLRALTAQMISQW